jgi:hypothetical protein
MGKIKAQAFRRNKGSGLSDMVAKDLPERGVEKMGGGVVITDGLPPGGIDGGLNAVTDPELAAQGFNLVGDEVRDRIGGALDYPGTMRPLKAAGVPDLASGFGIEGGLAQNDLASLARPQ